MVRVIVIEGSPDDVTKTYAALAANTPTEAAMNRDHSAVVRQEAQPHQSPALPSASNGAVQPLADVTKSVAQAFLRRRPLAPVQITVLKAISEAHPNMVPATDLQKLTGYTTAQFAGLMGALGRRLTNTPGFVPHTRFFKQQWDHALACNRYSLTDAAREAIAEQSW